MRAINADSLTCDHKHSFKAISMTSYDIILGYLWLEESNPDIDWPLCTWHYKLINTDTVEFMEPVEFENIICTGGAAFVIHPCNLNLGGEPIAFFSGITASEFKLPTPYEEYAELFDENSDLAVNAPHNHAINIEPDKNPSY
ncbi:hypothetical protein FQN50_000907 [Emmonsiellopsis sp. PD_5]|nr:hypothetical protein FQN50_000907 [Emmonsiellopsis sp. PD_5]